MKIAVTGTGNLGKSIAKRLSSHLTQGRLHLSIKLISSKKISHEFI